MNTVLIVGFGKIGKSKAKIYSELGFSVSIIEPNAENVVEIQSLKQYSVFTSIFEVELMRFNIIDICTPTGAHIAMFEQLMQFFPNALYVIEKPLCSTLKELRKFEKIIKNFPETQIVYSENYIFSSVLHEVSRLIVENTLSIKKIAIEFSKNRATDVKLGRFIDMDLEGFGIEIPHILMIVNRLGHSLTSVEEIETKPMKISRKIVYDRQGDILVKATLDKKIPFLFYQSMVGKTHCKSKYFAMPKKERNRSNRYRVMHLKCDKQRDIYVQFEPVNGNERYISKGIFVEKGKVIEQFEVEDNTLRYLIRHIDDILQRRVTCNKYLTPQYAIRVTKMLIKLQQLSRNKSALPYGF